MAPSTSVYNDPPNVSVFRHPPPAASSPANTARSRVSPLSVYHAVSFHIVSLVSCRQKFLRDKRRLRGDSDVTVASTASSSSSSTPADEEGAAATPAHGRSCIREDNDLYLGRAMHAEQSVCLNCRALFFVGLTPHIPDAFCSLDCRTCYQYVHRMQRDVDLAVEHEPPSLVGRDTNEEDDDDASGSDEDEFWEALDGIW